MLHLVEDHFEQGLPIQAAEQGLGRDKGPVLEILVDRRPPSTQGEIGAFLATAFDARVDVGLDRPEFGGLQHGRKIVLGHPTQHEVAVMRAGQAEQLGRE